MAPQEQPPALPGTLSRPDAQRIIDALNLRLHGQEQKFPVKAEDLDTSAKQLFPQLATPGDRKVNFGFGEISWPGGTPQSNLATVTHGLAVKPQAVLVTGTLPTPGDWWSPLLQTPTEAKFEFNCRCFATSPAAGTKGGFYWIAIG